MPDATRQTAGGTIDSQAAAEALHRAAPQPSGERSISFAAGIGAFLRVPTARKRLALEAGWELLRARLDTVRPATHYTSQLGSRDAAAPPLGPADEALAAAIGHLVGVVAAGMPFRARCLHQALAVRRMLARRGIRAVVHIGVCRTGEELDAHAWVTAGERIVSGDNGVERYVELERFS